ncbi:GntR family transcriptional regulator [Xylanimonas sp. McL0601]|uniref:GntR family transcriptional regulator n=1 Tax=Xylanimonas sp. McL0601 TaxID=3414739 RepID=UPI003CEDCDF7
MTSTTRPETISKSERVYRTLRRRIVDGTYVGGYRLVLDQLARELDVSPVPVREAVRRLEAEGLVTFTHNVGAQVRGIDVSDYAEAMETLAYLEGAVTSLAATHLTPERIAHARALNDEMRHLLEHGLDAVRFTELNERFHRVLCEVCPNGHLFSVLDREWQRMSRIRRSSFAAMPARSPQSVTEHDRILALLEHGAPADEIERAAREHKLRTMHEYLATRSGAAGV